MGKEAGQISEAYFERLMAQCNLDCMYIDDWYDYQVEGKIKVEVKSCRISVRHISNNLEGYRIGRFDFTDLDHREKQFKENIWVCLIVRHREECLLYGFVKAKQLNKTRYISLHKARELDPFNLDEWVEEIKKGLPTRRAGERK